MNNIKKNIVILGAGFIGKNLIKFFLSAGHNVKVLDNNVCPIEFSGKLIWSKGNFADKKLLSNLLNEDVDIVYHLISNTVPGNETDKRILQELYDNVFTTIEFLNICTEKKVKRIVFASSSSVYGIQKYFPIEESAPTNPISAHGIQKLTLEKYFQLYNYIEEIDISIVRISNPYGPGQNINGKQGFIALVIGSLINNTEVILRDNGNSIRDFIYIDDLIDALFKIGLDSKVPIITNIGSGIASSLNEVIYLIEENTGKSVKIIMGENRKVDIPKSLFDITLANRELNFFPKTKLKEGIIKTLNYHGLIT